MSQTATNLIEQSLRDVGALDEEDSASNAQITNTLMLLNQIVQALITEGVGIQTKSTYWLTAPEMALMVSQGYCTPTNILEVQKAIVRNSDKDIPLEVWTAEQWADYPLKSSVGIPEGVFYNKNDGNLYVAPWPSAASLAIALLIREVASELTAADVILDYPIGAYRMIQLELTARIAPTYGQNPTQCLLWNSMAKDAKADFCAGDRQKGLSVRKSLYCPR